MDHKRTQFARAGPHPVTFESVVALALDVGHHDRQHLLVHVNARDVVRHRPLLVGAESVPRCIIQGRELSRFWPRTARRSLIRSIKL
jgi:hypothetical protein